MFSRDHSCSSLIGRVPEISQKRGRTELSREIARSNSKIPTNCEYDSFHGNCRLLLFLVRK